MFIRYEKNELFGVNVLSNKTLVSIVFIYGISR